MVQFRQQVVVDASVVIKWFVREEHTDRALALVDRAAGGEVELSIPDFCLAECSNVIWRLVTKQRTLSPHWGETVMAQLAELPIEGVPSRDLIGTAYRVAVETGTTVYDAMYVSLAEALGATFVTADRRLCNQLSDTQYAPLLELL